MTVLRRDIDVHCTYNKLIYLINFNLFLDFSVVSLRHDKTLKKMKSFIQLKNKKG